MIIQNLTQENIDAVFNKLWGKGHPGDKPLFEAMIDMPCTFAFYKDDEPCAVGFMEPVNEATWRTHFAATEEGFKKIALPATLFFRRLSDQVASDGFTIEAYSHKNEVVKEWFEAIGFKDIVDKYVKSGKINHAVGYGAKGDPLCAVPAPIK